MGKTLIGCVLATCMLGGILSDKCMGKDKQKDKLPSYKTDITIGKGELSTIPYIAINPKNNNLLVLQQNGIVKVYDVDGKYLRDISTGMTNTTTIAASSKGDIYVFSTSQTEKTIKVRGRKKKMSEPSGVQCFVFSSEGKKRKELKLPGVMSAKAAKIMKGKLFIADLSKPVISVHKLSSGKKITEMAKGKLRLCCGIFDFTVDPKKKEVLVANLGAFKVSVYDAKKIKKPNCPVPNNGNFGKRGKGETDFIGCCNPVSLAILPNGNLITVEKDPTRIKVNNRQLTKASIFKGITEMVKGCTHIPVAVDKAGNLYLAANNRQGSYIVKCVKE